MTWAWYQRFCKPLSYIIASSCIATSLWQLCDGSWVHRSLRQCDQKIKYTTQVSMSIGTVEEEIVDRGSSREVSQVSKNQSGLLNWYNIPIKQSRFVDNILIKQSTHSLSHPFICLPELDLEEGKSGLRPLYSTHFRKS